MVCENYGVQEQLNKLDELCQKYGEDTSDGTLCESEMPLKAALGQRLKAKEQEKEKLLEMLAQSKAIKVEKLAYIQERRAEVEELKKRCTSTDATLESVHAASTRWINA